MKRALLVFVGAFALLLFLAVIQSEAAPIQPDARKLQQLLSEPQGQMENLPVARAGWNGPEISWEPKALNPTLEKLIGEASVRRVRASLVAAAVPDYRAVAGIVLVILLLRRIRGNHRKMSAAPTLRPTNSDSAEKRNAA